MGPNRRAQDRERAAAEAAAEGKRAEAERKAIAEAQKIIAIWNARQAGGQALWFYPTIGAAIAARLPWLSFSCPACVQFGSVVSRRRVYDSTDLRVLVFIRRSRELGFSLNEIRALLRLRGPGKALCREVRNIAAHHLQYIRIKIADLENERLLARTVAKCSGKIAPHCPVLDILDIECSK